MTLLTPLGSTWWLLQILIVFRHHNNRKDFSLVYIILLMKTILPVRVTQTGRKSSQSIMVKEGQLNPIGSKCFVIVESIFLETNFKQVKYLEVHPNMSPKTGVGLIYYSFGRLFYLFEFDYLQITSKIQAIWLNLQLQGSLPSLMVLTMQLLLATLSLILLISLVKFVHAFITGFNATSKSKA